MTGFINVDSATMIIIKKIIGAHVKKISESYPDFKKLNINLITKNNEYQTSININDSEDVHSIDDNIFVSIDSCIKKCN